MEDTATALDVWAAGDTAIKTNKARAKMTPTNRTGIFPTLTTRGSQAARMATA